MIAALAIGGAAALGAVGVLVLNRGGDDPGADPRDTSDVSICNPFSGCSEETDPTTESTEPTTDPPDSTTGPTAESTVPADPIDQPVLDSLVFNETEVEAAYGGGDWYNIFPDPAAVTYFCDILPSATPVLTGISGFSTLAGDLYVYSRVDHFASASDSARVFGQDESLVQLCDEFSTDVGGTAYTVTIFDGTSQFDGVLEGDFAAIGYHYAADDAALGLPEVYGIIVEKREGTNISTVELSAVGRELADADTDGFSVIVANFFDRTAAVG